MSSRLGDFLLGTDVLSGSQGSLADLITSIGSNPTWLRPAADGSRRAIAVEIALPDHGNSVLGKMILGVDVLSGLSWEPVTDRWQGAEITRGNGDGAHEVGTMTLALDNDDGALSPWSDSFPRGAQAYAGPGTLARVSTFHEQTGWLSQFCGLVESWNETKEALKALSSITITAVETTSLLARVDDIALTSPEGAGDTTPERVQRLLAAAGWPYGLTVTNGVLPGHGYGGGDGPGWPTHQSTLMAQNRLSELYLTTDSSWIQVATSTVFRADRSGAAWLGPEDLGWHENADDNTTPPWALWTVREDTDIVDESLIVANDDLLLTTVVNLATAGGTVTTTEFSEGIGRYGRRTFSRMDLNTTIGTDLSQLAWAALGKGTVTLRPVSFVTDEATIGPWAHAADLGQRIRLISDYARWGSFDRFIVAGLDHQLVPVGDDDLDWTITVTTLPGSSVAWIPV